MSAAEITPLLPADAPRCAELEAEIFSGESPWPVAAFRAALAGGQHYLAARSGDELVGYGGVALLGFPGSREAEVHTMAVDPRWQGLGIGRALLEGLLGHADRHRAVTFLEVRVDNDAALALYAAHGFHTIGRRRNYYQPSGADAFTMRREAEGGAR